jgi:general secretion pathway protein M
VSVSGFRREQVINVAILIALLLFGAAPLAVTLQMRADAKEALAESVERLARLEAHALSGAKSGPTVMPAPAAAFLDAPTQGLAVAQLQSYLSQAAARHHAVLISSGMQRADHDDTPDMIRIEASLNAALEPLQALLYQLETGTPYVFVVQLDVQQQSAQTGQRGPRDAAMHVRLVLRAPWRRGST